LRVPWCTSFNGELANLATPPIMERRKLLEIDCHAVASWFRGDHLQMMRLCGS